MNEFFSLEGPLISALDKCGRVVLLTILWIVTSIPLITITASSASFYYGITKTIRHERSSSAKEFFKCFKRVYKGTFLMSLGLVLLGVLLFVDMYYYSVMNSKAAIIKMNICFILLFVLVILCTYLFAIISRFNYKKKELIKFAAFVSFKHLPSSILCFITIAVMIWLIISLPFSFLFTPGIACVVISIVMEKVFKKYVPDAPEGEEQWYDE